MIRNFLETSVSECVVNLPVNLGELTNCFFQEFKVKVQNLKIGVKIVKVVFKLVEIVLNLFKTLKTFKIFNNFSKILIELKNFQLKLNELALKNFCE